MNVFRNILNVGLVATVVAAGTVQAALKHDVLYGAAAVLGGDIVLELGRQAHNKYPKSTKVAAETAIYGAYKYNQVSAAIKKSKVQNVSTLKNSVVYAGTFGIVDGALNIVEDKYGIGEKADKCFDGSWVPCAQGFYQDYAKPFAGELVKVVASALAAELAGGKINGVVAGFGSASSGPEVI
jgi:hypothetical protein